MPAHRSLSSSLYLETPRPHLADHEFASRCMVLRAVFSQGPHGDPVQFVLDLVRRYDVAQYGSVLRPEKARPGIKTPRSRGSGRAKLLLSLLFRWPERVGRSLARPFLTSHETRVPFVFALNVRPARLARF